MPARPLGLELLGAIAAGAPLDVFDSGDVELLERETLAPALPGPRQSAQPDVFALRVRGDSIIE